MRPKPHRVLSLLLALPLLLTGVASAAGLLVADGGFGGVLEIEEHRVRVSFNNGIVVTEVEQVFRNTEGRQVEALYTFPVPEGASVADFTMWIGGREMVGEVVEKKRAREIYASYKRVREDPGLLEQTDFRTFEMRIFPIGPGAAQRVRIAYYQELDFDGDWATYVYPLKTASREGLDSRTLGPFELHLDVTSEVPITALESPSHAGEFVVVYHSDGYYQASLESLGGDLNRDVVLAFQTERPKTGVDLVVTRQPGEDGTFQLTLTAGDELEAMSAGMDYVFVVDISGSMAEEGKLALSRASVEAFLSELGSADRFEVMSFNSAPQTAFQTLRGVDPLARAAAASFLESQRARDGTVLAQALRLAYQYKDAHRPLNVVVLSDGMTDQLERLALLRLAGRRPAATRIFCIGVGNEVDRRLLAQIAEEAGGLADFLSPGDDFTRRAQAFQRKLRRTAGTDLAIRIDGVGAYDIEPATLPSLFHGSPIRLYGRYKKAGTAQVHLEVTVGGERLDEWIELEFPDTEPANPELERMWALRRVDALRRQAERQGSRLSFARETVRLGEAYSIVTEHTSFLVLENDAQYRRWEIERKNALRLRRDHQAQSRVRQRLEELRGGSPQDIGPIVREPDQPAKVAWRPVPSSSPASRRQARPAQPPPARQVQPARAPRPGSQSRPVQARQRVDFGDRIVDALDPAGALLAAVIVGLALMLYRRWG